MNAVIFVKTRGVSPAIATFLLIAVTVVIAMASAFYYSNVMGAQTGFEAVEVRSVIARPVANLEGATNGMLSGSGWNVSITLKNTGTSQATIRSFLVNGRPLEAYDRIAVFDGSKYVQRGDIGLTIPCGRSQQVFIAISQGTDAGSGTTFSPGVNLEVALQSASGASYPRFVTLL